MEIYRRGALGRVQPHGTDAASMRGEGGLECGGMIRVGEGCRWGWGGVVWGAGGGGAGGRGIQVGMDNDTGGG